MAATKTRNLCVVCPKCFEEEASCKLDLNAIPEIECTSCNEVFTPAEAVKVFAEMAARWEAVAKWVADAPTI